MNFGRVLRDLRTEAGLSQADLAERIGRDRRRLMAFEQGTAVREPRPGEIALLATGLGIPEAADRLRVAVGTQDAKLTEFYQPIREEIRADVASEVSQLLTKLDDARELARGLSRSADKALVDAHITPAQLFRSGRAVADTWLQAHSALVKQAKDFLPKLKEEATAFEGRSGKRPRGSQLARVFKETQLGYWSRCDWASVKGHFDADLEPDEVERLLDLLESTVFHLHPLVGIVAQDAIGALGYLFLIWAGLALDVEPTRWPMPPKPTRAMARQRNLVESQREHIALLRLIEALEIFVKQPVPKFASILLNQDWGDSQVENLQLLIHTWTMAEGMADTIVSECYNRLNLKEMAPRFSPIAAQLKQAVPSHAPSHGSPEDNGDELRTMPRRKAKLSSE